MVPADEFGQVICSNVRMVTMTVLEVSEIDGEFCSHALIDKTDGHECT
jgi:hypothetical protein